ncbi:alcohol acetyltransferase [Neofusicoccum parvum]|uniref:Alcohol acetyltransferase n=1 Tax=Neofusicoccum parvum TaxID=310453 RepID=A0ACB5S2C5_9PEZI|nr:alcohol acetyltransferase [Neofusicoccum parvum]
MADFVSLRPAGKSERRCIMRHALGYYRALIIAGRYTMPPGFDFSAKESFFPALKHCISTHPMLSAAIRGELTEAPELVRPATLDLSNHIDIAAPISPADRRQELEALKQPLRHAHDQQFQHCDRIPPWKIIVVPTTTTAAWILFSYSHSHGDGPSGLTFHRTLLAGLQQHPPPSPSPSPLFPPPSSPPLLPPLEASTPLPISWSYLLTPLLAAHLPASFSSLLGLRASALPSLPGTWTASPTAYAPPAFTTGLAFAVADPETVGGLLARCRAREGVKLTGVLHALAVRALSGALGREAAGAFAAQTAVDLRRLVVAADGVGAGDVGLCVSVAYHGFERDDEEGFGEGFWGRARATTEALRARAASLVDQPIGLLAYLRSFRPWLEGQVGRVREASYEISNVMAFEAGAGGGWDVDGVVFSQPANATGCPVCFSVVSMKGGDLVVALTWQEGVLGVDGDEDAWARGVCGALEESMKALAAGE